MKNINALLDFQRMLIDSINQLPVKKIIWKETFNRSEFESYPDVFRVKGRVYRKVDSHVEIIGRFIPENDSMKYPIIVKFRVVKMCIYRAIYELS